MIAFVTLMGTYAIVASPAQAFPTNAEMRDVGHEESGLSVERLARKSLGVLAREMLLPHHLDADANLPHPQRRGVQIDLFAPGDIGVVLHYRW